LVDRIAQPFLWFVLLAAASAAAWWWPTDPGHALMVAAAVLIVTCPCALSLATPVAMLTAAGHLAKQGVLVQNLPALEALAEVDTVIFDKTGTLSEDRLSIQGIRVRAGLTEHMALQQAASLAQYSLHPVSRALVAYAQQQGCTLNAVDNVQEQAGMGLAGVCQGHVLHLGRATWCGVEIEQTTAHDNAHVHLSDEQGWLASFAWGEALRPEALHTVQTLQAAGLEVRMLSGDSAAAVARVAQALGLAHARGDCSPQDKLAAMQALQAQGRRVAMVGDGLNDAPVLARAHVAIALGQGMAVTHTRADLVVMGDLQSVAHALKLSRFTRRVVRQNLGWAMAYNLACVPLAVLGYLPAWLAGLGMATSSLGVVLNAWRLRSRSSSGTNPSSLQKVV
jgi:Cu2+-exporting ATPase